jgi:hypothetical protein
MSIFKKQTLYFLHYKIQMEEAIVDEIRKVRHVEYKNNLLVRMVTHVTYQGTTIINAITHLILISLDIKNPYLEFKDVLNHLITRTFKGIENEGVDLVYDQKKDMFILFTKGSVIYLRLDIRAYDFKILKIMNSVYYNASFDSDFDPELSEIFVYIQKLTYLGCCLESDRVYYLTTTNTNNEILFYSRLYVLQLSNFKMITEQEKDFGNQFVQYKKLILLGNNLHITHPCKFLFASDKSIYVVGHSIDYKDTRTHFKKYNPKETSENIQYYSTMLEPINNYEHSHELSKVSTDKWSDGPNLIYITNNASDKFKVEVKSINYNTPKQFNKKIVKDVNPVLKSYNNIRDVFMFDNKLTCFYINKGINKSTYMNNLLQNYGTPMNLLQEFRVQKKPE